MFHRLTTEMSDHFILTNSDLFDGTAAAADNPMDENDRLALVRDELMAQPSIRNLNVEIPLCAVLPDRFAQIEEHLDQAHEHNIMSEQRARAHLTTKESLAAVGKFLAMPAGAALRIAPDMAIGRNAFSDRIADMFIDWAGRPFDDKVARVSEVVDDARLQLGELRVARNAVLREFSERMIVLKRQLPASDRTDGGSRD
jgi:hypothetical protein